jgi:anti-anti-sigma factor
LATCEQFSGDEDMLNVTVEHLNDIVVLRCTGRIVRGEETALLCAASQQQGRSVVLDLGRVDAIDAAGIGLLVSLQAAGIYLRLMNPNQNVREMLRLTHLDSIFEFCEPLLTQEMPKGGPVNDELRFEQGKFRLTA